MSDVIVRMPPSPTGYLHLGTARTALFNWLFARAHNGKIIFRWEDTDKERSKPEYEEEILDGLAWLGMDFRTGSDVFCRQSERAPIHQSHLQRLWAEGKVFPCFVTQDELNAQREAAQKNKTNFVFWSPFRDTPTDELQARIDAGEPHVWRIRTPKDETLTFPDAIRGQVSTPSHTLGDFVVARADGSVLYLLANVIDDATQGVTHVIRGEDHISNTPKQILLYRALGFPLPIFAHIPLVLNHQRKKLSKRNVDPGTAVLIRDFRAQGFLPQAVTNGLAFLGWTPQDLESEVLSLAQLESLFSLTRVQKGAAQYDFEKMRWFNRQWIGQLPPDDLTTAYTSWATAHATDTYVGHPQLTQALATVQPKVFTFTEVAPIFTYLLQDPGFEAENLAVKGGVNPQEMLTHLIDFVSALTDDEFTPDTLKSKAIERIKALELKNAHFLPPWRTALTNQTPSFGPFEVAPVLGKAETLRRLQRAQDTLS